jgi:apolipoprotein N-acyltransferase
VLHALVVQPFASPEERFNDSLQSAYLASLAEQTKRGLIANSDAPIDVVVWPETALLADGDQNILRELEAAVARLGIPVIGGIAQKIEGTRDYWNTAVWVEPDRGIVDSLSKTHAIPILEERSWFSDAVGALALGLPRDRGLVVEGVEERPLRGNFTVAVTLCYELFFPRVVAARRTANSGAIVDLASDSWSNHATAHASELAFASFRAIEQRLPLARASHGGPSFVLDGFGRMVDRLPHGSPGVLYTRLAATTTALVDEVAILSTILCVGAGAGALVARMFGGLFHG